MEEKNKKKPENNIDELGEALYSRDETGGSSHFEPRLRKHDLSVRGSWSENPQKDAESVKRFMPHPKHKMTFLTKLFIGSVAFFAVSLAVATYVFYGGSNFVSSENVNITVTGPVSVAGGEDLSLEVVVENLNNTALEAADLLVEYPEGTKRSGDLSSDLKRTRELLGDVSPGDSVSKKAKAVLFGEEGTKKEIMVSVEYRIKGSNAIFYKEKKYEVVISSSPVVMKITSLKEVNANQEVEFIAEINSNSSAVLHDLLLKVDYPFGFAYTGGTPAPTYGRDTWVIGDLQPESKRTIRLRGKIEGQNEEERTFKFTVGRQSPQDEKLIGTAFLTTAQPILIQRPFVGLDVALDGDNSKEFITNDSKTVRADILWVNNLPTRINDLRIEARLRGSAYNRESVSAEGGLYRLSDDVIVWDQTSQNNLTVIDPGASGQVSFTFELPTLPAGARNPEMSIEISAVGKRFDDPQNPGEITTAALTRKVKIQSDLAVSSKLLFASGPFPNSGPIPPKVDQVTTYTVGWSLSNTANAVSGVKVRAKLPSYVKWIETWSPKTERVTFNPVGGEILWEPRELKAGTGYDSAARELFFQISVQPSVNQVGVAPVLITEVSAEGEDRFTKTKVLSNVWPSLTTSFSTEPGFRLGDDIVTR